MMKKIMTAASLTLITMSLMASTTFARDYAGRDVRGNIQERHNQVTRQAQAVADQAAPEAPRKVDAPARKARARKR